METVVLIAVIILVIGIGMRWLHLLNPSAPHGSRPTASVTPCRGRPACRTTPVVEPTTRVPTGEERTFLRPGAAVGAPRRPDPPSSSPALQGTTPM